MSALDSLSSSGSGESNSLAAAKKNSRPVVAAILAAGLSRRMGAVNKLVQEIDGVPMVRQVAQQVLASRCSRVIVVLGHEAGAVREAFSGLDVEFVTNNDYHEGLAASVRIAARAARDGEALLICLGDMPSVSELVINQLIDAYQRTQDHNSGDHRISGHSYRTSERSASGHGVNEHSTADYDGIAAYQPQHNGRRGNPVLWAPRAVPLLISLKGDEGARGVLKSLGNAVREVPVQNDGIFMDIDTPEALAKVRGQVG